MQKAIYRAFWNKLNNDEAILSVFGMDKNTDKKIVRERILKHIPTKYISSGTIGDDKKLPKLIVLSGVRTREYSPIPFLDKMFIEVHAWSKDETYAQNEELLNRVQELVEEEVFQITDSDNISYWSNLEFEGQAIPPLYVSDLYILFQSYSIVLAPKENKKLWAVGA